MSLSAEEKKRVAKLVCRSYYHRTRSWGYGSPFVHFYKADSSSPSGVLRIGGCPDKPEYHKFINEVREHIKKGD